MHRLLKDLGNVFLTRTDRCGTRSLTLCDGTAEIKAIEAWSRIVKKIGSNAKASYRRTCLSDGREGLDLSLTWLREQLRVRKCIG
jgi:hypothetical protein